MVPGTPQSKPRMTRRDVWKQRPRVLAYRAWCDRARAIAGQMPDEQKILALNWVAYFEPPPSWSQAKRSAAIGELHRSRPDRDNIDKAVLDCLFASDSGIASGTIEKRWDWHPRVEIEILFLE